MVCLSLLHNRIQCIEMYRWLKKRRPLSPKEHQNVQELTPLTVEQNKLFNTIKKSNKKHHLIRGVTGSGKTQIYAHLINNTIMNKQSVLMLIPEISLTPQFTSFFSTIFPNIGVIHSGLTTKNKEIIWNQCLNNELTIIIGPRSAIFMPLDNIGLIIIDEEHDASYKQESSPRYYTHEVAIKRSDIHQAKLIFGSATPSLTTYAQSKQSSIEYHQLNKRYNNISMPKVHILDMKTTQKNYIIHDEMITCIEATLKEKKKALILVNRRGYSSFLKCNACGAIQKCNDCNTSYTYHSDGYFRCHQCLKTKKMTRKCSSCNSYDVEYYGVAIQKVYYELSHLFPNSNITRIDRDTVKNITELQTALTSINKTDILIGTQMIAKGHNFPDVGMVGIIGVDTMLSFPDFRASERLFQLVTQMAGRAGRDQSGSLVYIQTFQPNHYAFSFVKTHDVSGFLNQEYEYREPFGYPPFKAIINVIFSAKDNKKAVQLYPSIKKFNVDASKQLDITAIGPKVAPIEKVNGYFRHNVFYKIGLSDVIPFKEHLKKFLKNMGFDLSLILIHNPYCNFSNFR